MTQETEHNGVVAVEAAETKSTTCECVEKANTQLAKFNTRLSEAIVFGGKRKDNLMLQTEQIEKGRGKAKAVAMFLSFCPFCGVKYEEGASQ